MRVPKLGIRRFEMLIHSFDPSLVEFMELTDIMSNAFKRFPFWGFPLNFLQNEQLTLFSVTLTYTHFIYELDMPKIFVLLLMMNM